VDRRDVDQRLAALPLGGPEHADEHALVLPHYGDAVPQVALDHQRLGAIERLHHILRITMIV
jgi:hypothetical protein